MSNWIWSWVWDDALISRIITARLPFKLIYWVFRYPLTIIVSNVDGNLHDLQLGKYLKHLVVLFRAVNWILCRKTHILIYGLNNSVLQKTEYCCCLLKTKNRTHDITIDKRTSLISLTIPCMTHCSTIFRIKSMWHAFRLLHQPKYFSLAKYCICAYLRQRKRSWVTECKRNRTRLPKKTSIAFNISAG